MNDIERYTQLLCDSIRQSKEYLRYEKAKNQLEIHSELREELNAFRQACYESQRSAGPEELPEIMEKLCDEQKRLFSSPVMREYISSEQDYCAMIRQLYLKLAAITDLELGGMEQI